MADNIAKNLTQNYWDKLLDDNFSLKGVGWSNWPESYNLILYKKYLKGFEKVINDLHVKYEFKLDENKLVFEVGPGTGFYTNYFLQAGIKQYVGSDISESSVSNLKKKYPSYEFIRADIALENVYIEKYRQQFDLVCIVDVLLHITDDTRFRMAVDNASELLKPNGFMIVGDAISIYRKTSHSQGTKYTHDVSRHIDYVREVFADSKLELLETYHRHNFLLNKNFDFKYPVFEIISKSFFWILNGCLYVFRNSNLMGYLIGMPLYFLDSIVTPFQKHSKNSKFLLFKKG